MINSLRHELHDTGTLPYRARAGPRAAHGLTEPAGCEIRLLPEAHAPVDPLTARRGRSRTAEAIVPVRVARAPLAPRLPGATGPCLLAPPSPHLARSDPRVIYAPDSRSIVLRRPPARARCGSAAPRYDTGLGFGQVTWPIERGLPGRRCGGRGNLRISVRRDRSCSAATRPSARRIRIRTRCRTSTRCCAGVVDSPASAPASTQPPSCASTCSSRTDSSGRWRASTCLPRAVGALADDEIPL